MDVIRTPREREHSIRRCRSARTTTATLDTITLNYLVMSVGGPREERREEKPEDHSGSAEDSTRETGERSMRSGAVTVSRTCPAAHIHAQRTVACVVF